MSTQIILKNRKYTVQGILRSTSALKAVAFVKIGKAKNFLNDFEYPFKLAQSILGCNHDEEQNIPSLNIVIGADKGMCGDFTHNLIKYIKHNLKGEKLFILGKQLGFLKDAEKCLYFNTIPKNSVETFNLSQEIVEVMKKNKIEKVYIHAFYNLKIRKFFMMQIKDVSLDNNFIQFFITTNLLEKIIRSSLEENKQRMFAVEQAKNNAKDMKKSIERDLNRIRQDSITTQLNEMISGVI